MIIATIVKMMMPAMVMSIPQNIVDNQNKRQQPASSKQSRNRLK
jgi:hypothetical protein